ncbi:LAGLIDADG family homing endonuclease [Caldifermentibacillus hisashii]|uniref:LAGLIDADG family homing endonuclease n=1 Tax=Caldifermentibacillus hisashii TaxID=996558 RepID=UPI0031B75476
MIKWTNEKVENMLLSLDKGYRLLEIIREKKATFLFISCPQENHSPQKMNTGTFSKRIDEKIELCDQCAGRKHHHFDEVMPKEKLFHLYVEKNMSSTEIALKLGEGVTRQHINHLLRKYDIPRKQQQLNRPKPLQHRLPREKLYFHYVTERKSQIEIAKIYNENPASIKYLMQIYRIPARNSPEANKLRSLKYAKVNTGFFEKFSYEFFYVLGVFLSDGWRSGNLIGIQMTDNDVIEYIAKVIGYTGEIRTRKPRYGGKVNGKQIYGRKIIYEIQFRNFKVAQILNDWGLVERKSKKLLFPKIPKKFVGAFLRGFLDGDGSVIIEQQKNSKGTYKTKQFRLVFYTSSKQFRDSLCELLKKEYTITGGSGFEKESGKYYLSIGNKQSVYTLCRLLYKDINVFGMERKKKKIIYILDYQKSDKIPEYKRLSIDEVKIVKQLLNQGIPIVKIVKKLVAQHQPFTQLRLEEHIRIFLSKKVMISILVTYY